MIDELLLIIPRIEDLSREELDLLHNELYEVMLSLRGMGISKMNARFLREHFQHTLDEIQALLAQINNMLNTHL